MAKKIIWNNINKKSIPHLLHQPIWLWNGKKTILCSRINAIHVVFENGNITFIEALSSNYKITHWAHVNQELEHVPKFK